MNLFDWLLIPVGSIVIGLVVPGSALLLLFKKRISWTLTDAFFTGWVWVAGIGALILPFAKDTATLILLVRSFTLVMTVSALILFFVRREPGLSFIKQCFRKSFSSAHFLVLFCVLAVSLPLVFTHSIGFDDTAHLDFLSKVLQDTPFQDFRDLIHPRFNYLHEEWLAARYPFFGVLIAYFSLGITGSMIFVYYWLGILLMTGILLKSFEWVSQRNNSKRMGLVGASFVALVLAVLGPDNYFNYCIYPLQEGKLLFITGVLYIFLGWNKNKISFDFVLGVGLITAAWLHHLNILLVYAATIPLVITVILLRSNHNRLRVRAVGVILLALCIVGPSLVWPEKGALRIKNLEQQVPHSSFLNLHSFWGTAFAADSINEDKNRRTGSTDFIKILKIPFKWFQFGIYIEVYAKRVFSPEIIGVIGGVLFLPLLGGMTSACVLIGIVSLLIVCSQTVMVFPQQAAVSMFRSGAFWLIKDLAAVKPQISKDRVYWSDPYTALYLRSLYGVDARGLSDWGQVRLFYPFFNNGISESLQSDPGIMENHQVVLNSRYWGARVNHHWSGDNGIVELERIQKSSYGWLYNGKIAQLNPLLMSLVSIFREKWGDQITISSSEQITGKLDCIEKGFVQTDEIFKEAVVKSLTGFKKDDEIEITFVFRGYGVQLLQQAYSEPTDLDSYRPYQLKMKLKGGNDYVKVSQRQFEAEANPLVFIEAKRNTSGNKVKAVFRVKKDIDRLYLLVKVIGFGHFRGNGELYSVTVERLDSNKARQ